jgi:hypothetical protein
MIESTAALARSLDQFFTRADVAEACISATIQHVKSLEGDWHWLEPSAGSGAFLERLPFPRTGLDIVSLRPDVSRIDFLSWQPGDLKRRIAVVGNPPFGKNASLARRFFDHAANFADVIAFILPRTFEKPMFINRLNRHMHLVSSTVLDDCSFEFAGEPYSVPTSFQIWERRVALRPLAEATRSHDDFEFVAQPVGDFAFQRVGARAGLVSVEGLRKSPQSHYFLRANMCSHTLLNRLRSIDWAPIKHRTAGNPSIGKAELVDAYKEAFGCQTIKGTATNLNV